MQKVPATSKPPDKNNTLCFIKVNIESVVLLEYCRTYSHISIAVLELNRLDLIFDKPQNIINDWIEDGLHIIPMT